MDKGKEFYNTTFARMLACESIRHFSTHGDAKASVVERLNRMLKLRFFRHFNEAHMWRRLYAKRLQGQKRPRRKAGYRVCLSKKHCPFKKGYLPGWTGEVFMVQPVVPGPVTAYRLTEWDCTSVEGQFYEEDVQRRRSRRRLVSRGKVRPTPWQPGQSPLDGLAE